MLLENEPVRGGYPPPGFNSLTGLERARAIANGLVPAPPFYRLTGMRVTHAASGSATVRMPASRWLGMRDGGVNVVHLVTTAHAMGAMTVIPAGSVGALSALHANFIRPATLNMENFVAKARVVMAGASRVTTEVIVEDVSGRLLNQSTAQSVQGPDVPPPPAIGPLERFAEPTYPTPDPPMRLFDEDAGLNPLRGRPFLERAQEAVRQGRMPGSAFLHLMGIRVAAIDEGEATLAMRASEWLCGYARNVIPGFQSLLSIAATMACLTEVPDGMGYFLNTFETLFVGGGPGAKRPRPDGRELTATAKVVHIDDFRAIADAKAYTADGEIVAFSRSMGSIVSGSADGGAVAAAERVLTTVLFADVVDSTPTAERLGDAKWRELLQQNLTVVDREIAAAQGRAVKTEGDGFLATFDSPARAIKCARAVRAGARRLGLEIRAGIHLGEVERMGTDVAGIAVHVASRVESAAQPGEVLVTSTVREAMSGSGIAFSPRGAHQLKGLQDEWQLFAVED